MYPQRMENLMKILIIATGSIAIKKLDELINVLIKKNFEIDIIISKSGLSILRNLNINKPKKCRVFSDKDFLNKNNNMLHIELTRRADTVLVYPASANIIAKFANGVADDFSSSTLLASNKQIFIAPAMNTEMWNNVINAGNIEKLKDFGVVFLGPIYGNLACGEVGKGRISHTKFILDELTLYLKRKNILSGLKGIITSGPTIEKIDSTRYISNFSSGKQGHAIAKALSMVGAKIDLVSGPTNLDIPIGVRLIKINSAKQMNEAVMDLIPSDFAICAAAVADFKPSKNYFNKIEKKYFKKIDLKINPDILYNISNSKKKRPKLVVGFAAETKNLVKNAKNKLLIKKCDWILANKITKNNNIFGSDKNKITYVTKNSYESWPKMSKLNVAKKLNNKILNFFENNES